MNRRKFLARTATAGAAAATFAASAFPKPAIAQSMPELKWRLTSSFPKSLDTLYGGSELFAKRVAELTDNRFQIATFAAGEIVPGLQVFDAVQNGTVEMGQTAAYYYFGKDPAVAFDTGIPFGLNSREHLGWMHHGGGLELFREFYRQYNIVNFVYGGTGAQMGGWFRKEIKTVDDLKGLKFRVGGFAGLILSRLGVVPQQIAGGDIYPALEKGTIDAAEWVGPYDDEKLGFNKIAPYYYYPGWWEGCSFGALYVGLPAWESLPPIYKRIIETTAFEVTTWMVSKYDAVNPAALKRLGASGTKLLPFPRPVMEACFDEAFKVYDETAARSPWFKKVYESWRKFQGDEHLWFRVAENTFDNFVLSMSAKRS